MIWKSVLMKINQVSRIQRCNFNFRFQESFQKNFRCNSRSNGGFRWNRSRSKRTENVFYSLSVLGSIKEFFTWHKPQLNDDEIKNNIKLAVVYVTEKKYDDAYNILQTTLRLAKERKNDSAENYCLDMLANLYYQKGQMEQADKLFTELMRRLLSTGTPQNDPSIIEISLKLSEIYALNGDHEKADIGYQFCIASARDHVVNADQTFENKWTLKPVIKSLQAELSVDNEIITDPYALYGIVLETYAEYLVGRGKVELSIEYVNRALELAYEIYGPSNGQTILMINNYAYVCLRNNFFETALKYMTEVVNRAEPLPDLASHLPDFYCNYAEALWHCNQREKAMQYADKAIALCKKQKNENMLKYCHDFFTKLQSSGKRR